MSYYGDGYGYGGSGAGGYRDNRYGQYVDRSGRYDEAGYGSGGGSYRGGVNYGQSGRGNYDSRQGGSDRHSSGGGNYRDNQGGGGYRDHYSSRGDRNQQRGRGRGGNPRGGGRGGFKRKFDGGEGGYDNKRYRDEDDIPEDNWKEKHPLMQSAFMESALEGSDQDWFFVICPSGSRRLLVAANDISQSYDNLGKPDLKFNSCLPNGGPEYFNNHKYDDLTILDTFYSPELKTFYVLDMLHWKHYPYYDTEAEFRFFFLKDKYADLKDPSTVTDKNEYVLELLEKTQYSQTSLLSALKAFEQKVEGLLFIKKTSQYLCHDSYDSLWLKLDQMETVLGYPVPEGVTFTETTDEDIRLRSEFKQREKLRAEREAAKERQDEDLKTRLEQEGESSTNEPENDDYGESAVSS